MKTFFFTFLLLLLSSFNIKGVEYRIYIYKCKTLIFNTKEEWSKNADEIYQNGYYSCDCIYIPEKYNADPDNSNYNLGVINKEIPIPIPTHTGDNLIYTFTKNEMLYAVYQTNRTYNIIKWAYVCDKHIFIFKSSNIIYDTESYMVELKKIKNE